MYRKIMDKGYYKRSQYVHLWIHILLKASHDEAEFLWNKKIERLMPGQFITGRNSLSLETGIPPSTIEDILNLLEKEQQIQQLKNNKFRLLTVLNWNGYQQFRQQKQHLADSQPTSSQHLADTFKKEEEHKNERKEKDIDVLASHILAVLKIPMSDKGQTEILLKRFGLEFMVSSVNRMKIYFETVRENKWTKYIIGKHWRNLYEKLEYFSTEENLKVKIQDTERSNIKIQKIDGRTVSNDFSSDEELMRRQREDKNV